MVSKITCQKSRGFSLVELVVVIAIIGIVLGITSIKFGTWQRKYSVEAQIRELASDFSDVRLMAIKMKRAHQVAVEPKSIVFRAYSTEGDVGGTKVFTKDLKYEITRTDGSSISGLTFRISDRGFIESGTNPPTMQVGRGLGDFWLDCIVISSGRVNTGKLNGTNCEFK